jgi:hypothetical protein
MSPFTRSFECNNKPVVVTFTPVGNSLLAVTAEMEGRQLVIKGATCAPGAIHLHSSSTNATATTLTRVGYRVDTVILVANRKPASK